MQCRNHPQAPAKDRCAGCAETFCENCLVTVYGQSYCGSCKVMAVQGRRPPILEKETELCEDARNALILAIMSSFCIAPIFGIIALVKAHNAKQTIRDHPRLMGWSMATVAQVMAVIHLVLWCLTKVGNMAHLSP